MKVYQIPEGTRSSKGRAIQNVIQIEPDDKVRAYINVKRLDDEEYVNNNYIVMCTKDGTIKKTRLRPIRGRAATASMPSSSARATSSSRRSSPAARPR